MLDHPQTPLSIISRNLFARDYSRKHSDRITYTTCTHLMRVIRREAMAAHLVDLESRFVIWSICSWKRPSFVHNNNKTANSPFSRTAKGLKTREINRSRERKKKFPGFSSAPIQTQSSSFPPFFCAPFSRSDPDICSFHTRLKAVSWTTFLLDAFPRIYGIPPRISMRCSILSTRWNSFVQPAAIVAVNRGRSATGGATIAAEQAFVISYVRRSLSALCCLDPRQSPVMAPTDSFRSVSLARFFPLLHTLFFRSFHAAKDPQASLLFIAR